MSKRPRRNHAPAFKAQVTREALIAQQQKEQSNDMCKDESVLVVGNIAEQRNGAVRLHTCWGIKFV